MKSIPNLMVTLLALALCSCNSETRPNNATIKADIMAVITAQEAAWNRGDIPGFMEGYVRSDSLRFASGGSITYGWQTTLERYQKGYRNRADMGNLTFSQISIDVLSRQAALVFGRWQLTRKNDAPWGLFTLLFKHTADGWKIFADHTSSARHD